MTVCPIAIAVGCARCPAVKVCPLKGVLGDAKKPEAAAEPTKTASAARKPAAKTAGAKKKR